MAAARSRRTGMRLTPWLTWRGWMSAAILWHTCVAWQLTDDRWPDDGRFALNASQVAAVMCIGDSWMTGFNVAGYGLDSLAKVKKANSDYRGGSWGCGNGIVTRDQTTETLGTLVRRFNPKLAGLSKGEHPFNNANPCDARHRAVCGLNAAVDGAALLPRPDWATADRNGTLLDQARDLRRWIDEESPHLLHQWKVLTFMPSWGDQWWTERDIERIRAGLRELFSYLRDALPKTYVNLVSVTEHPSSLDQMMAEQPWCQLRVSLWKATNFVRHHTRFNKGLGADEYARQINHELHAIAREFGDGERFVIRVRTMMLELTFQRRLMEPTTCFHPSTILVGSLALGLLQNMVSQGPSMQLTRLPVYDEPPDRQLALQVERFRKHVLTAPDLVFR